MYPMHSKILILVLFQNMNTETRSPRGLSANRHAPLRSQQLTKSQMFAAAFFRVAIPLALICSFTLRVNAFSGVFLILFFIHPFVSSPGKPSSQMQTKLFLSAIIVISTLFLLAQGSFLVSLYTVDDLPGEFTCNSTMGETYIDIGLGDLYEASWWMYFVYFGPEVVLILTSVCSLLSHVVALNSLKPPKSTPRTPRPSRDERQNASETSNLSSPASEKTPSDRFQRSFAYVIGILNILALIGAACCVPSLISLAYLLVFLTIGTGHSVSASTLLTTGINSLSYVLVLVSALHFVTIYIFQFHFIDDKVDYDSTWLRLTGIKRILNSSCVEAAEDNMSMYIHDLPTEYYVQPFVILVLYYLIAHYTGFWAQFTPSDDAYYRDTESNQNVSFQNRHSRISRSYMPPVLQNFMSPTLESTSEYVKNSFQKFWFVLKKTISSLSYLVSVAVQIFWSVWCLGLIGLVLLLVAIYLWVRSNSQMRTLNAAPFLVVFCTVYILVQYIFNLDYIDGEFVDKTHTIDFGTFNLTISLEDIRLTKDSMPHILYLGVQCIFLCVFWFSLRSCIQHYKEKRGRIDETHLGSTNSANGEIPLGSISDETESRRETADDSSTQAILQRVREIASAVWMSICIVVLLFVSTHGFPTAFNIVYMLFFIVFANYTVFTVGAGITELPDFEKFLRLILLFTMTALCVIYIYQFSFFFDQFDFFKEQRDVLSQFGLTNSVSDTLEIVYPTAVLLIVIKIQFDFFGDSFKSFMRHFKTNFSAMEDESLPPGSETRATEMSRTSDDHPSELHNKQMFRKRVKAIAQYIRERLWVWLVVHTDKLFLMLLFVAIMQEISAVNLGFMTFYVLMCTMPQGAGGALKKILFVLTCGVVIIRMAYQNQLINENVYYDVKCDNTSISNRSFIDTNLFEWIGLTVYDDKNAPEKKSALTYLWFYLLLIICVLLESLMHCRMNAKKAILERRAQNENTGQARKASENLKKLKIMLHYRIIFPEVNRKNADDSLISMLKFLTNFVFHKFGLEVTVLTVLLNCGLHADFYSSIYLLILVPMILSSRKKLLTKANILTLVTAFFLIIKFVFLLWLPPLDVFCGFTELNWLEHPKRSVDTLSLKRFFFIPDFNDPKSYSISAGRLLGDFFQLLILKYLLTNLREEKNQHGTRAISDTLGVRDISPRIADMAGNNDECLSEEHDENSALIPAEDGQGKRIIYSKSNFITDEKDTLNVIKKVIFSHGIWATYAVVCLTGMQDVDVFGFIFFGLGFYLLWVGQDIALRPRKNAVYRMNVILTYTTVTCILRVLFQLVPFYCYTEFFTDGGHADFLRFLNMFDITMLNKYYGIPSSLDQTKQCPYTRLKSDLIEWETVCVLFLLLQRRIFVSHYYDFVMQDAKESRALAVEGGKLIQKMNDDDLKARTEMRNKISKQLQNAVEQIKKRFKGEEWVEPKTHLEAIFSGHKFFAGSPEDESLINALEASEELSLFLAEPVTPDDEIIAQRWKPFTDFIEQKLKISKDDKKDESTETIDQREKENDSQAKDCDTEEIDKSYEKEHNKTDDADSNDVSETRSQAPILVSKMTYYLLYGVTLVLKELGFVMDRASSSFRQVNKQLIQFRKTRQRTETTKYGPLRMPTVIDRKPITSNVTDVAIDIITEDTELGANSPEAVGQLTPGSSDSPRPRSSSVRDILENPEKPPTAGEFMVLLLKKFWLSFYYFLVAQTDYLCYFMITLSLLLNGSIADAVLALLTLLWGLLSKPRPSKTFWSFCITYVVGLILLKYCLKFRVLDYNNETLVPPQTVPPGLVLFFGIKDDDSLFITQLLLLISLCFHRNVLVNFGLWIGPPSPGRKLSHRSEESGLEPVEESDPKDETAPLTILRKPTASQEPQGVGEPAQSIAAGGNGEEDELVNQEGNHSGEELIASFSNEPPQEQILPPDLVENELESSGWKDWAVDKAIEYKNEFMSFFYNMKSADNTAVKDVYAPMFFFDAMGYVIVVFGYHGFSVSNDDAVDSGGTLVSIVSENQVPVLFLAIVMILFVYQLFDRLAYLTKNVKLKIFIFTSQVLLVHFWLIIVNKNVTGKYFSENTPAKVFYFFRWIYWLLSAYQIKCSYPVRVLGNFFSKRYNMVYKVCMLVFVNIPFAFEIRVLMDWIFTGTTLSFNRWLEVEDVFTTTFILNCTRIAEQNMKQKRGQTQKVFPSKIVYFSVLIVLLVIIWGPILLFSYLNATKVSTEITYTNFKLQIGSYLPIFEASQIGITSLTSDEFAKSLSKDILGDVSHEAELMLNFYNADGCDFSKVKYSSESENIWTITPPAQKKLIDYVNSSDEVLFYVEYQFSRVSLSSSASNFPTTSQGSTTIQLDEQAKEGLANLIQNGSSPTEYVDIIAAIPSVYYIQDTATVDNETVSVDRSHEWYTIRLKLNGTANDPGSYTGLTWWLVDTTRMPDGDASNFADSFNIYIVMDKVVPDMYSSVASYGILGLYTAFVLLISNVVKGMFTGFAAKIMWDEIPDVSLLQNLTKEIYLCRETKNFELEEDLYAQLQYLYRSPDAMIRNTKYKIE